MFKMNRVIIMGAGIAGLIMARMLSEYYQEVYLVERDKWPSKPTNRIGTPQAFHPHRILPRGNMILERYFPGYNQDLLQHGAHASETDEIALVNQYGTLVVQPPSVAASCSRALLEWVLYRRVQRIDNVFIRTNTEITGLISSENGQTICGVYTKDRQNQQVGQLSADMVIDTTGRSSKIIKWLHSLGYTVPEPEVLKVSLGYSTRYYKIPTHLGDGWRFVISYAQPEKGISMGTLNRFEQNIAGITLFRAGGDNYPSVKAEEFQEELKKLSSPEIAEMERQLEPLQGPRGYRTPETVRQHFEQMEQWPCGLLVMGDAYCHLDPIHGQGITVAAIETEIIEALLEEQHRNPQPNFERRVLHRIQEAIAPAWWLSAVADLRWKGVKHIGSVPLKGVSFAQAYLDLFTKKAMEFATKGNQQFYLTEFLMNALILPPSQCFNANILSTILDDHGSPEEQRLRAELVVQDPSQFQQRIDECIPSFDSSFDDRLKELLSSFA